MQIDKEKLTELEKLFKQSMESGIAPITKEEFIEELREIVANIGKD